MMRLLCLFRIHDWQRMKWGTATSLDSRGCRRCRRFEVYAYGSFHPAKPRRSPMPSDYRALGDESKEEA